MTGYGQFCSVARAHEVLGGRWTLLVVRELLCGSSRFNDIRRGIPRISRTMLSERLQALTFVGAVARTDGEHGPEYALTEAGKELAILVGTLGTWGQRWLPRMAKNEDIDLEPLLIDMQRRVRFAALPKHPIVVRFEIGRRESRFMLLKAAEASLCLHNPGFPEPLHVRSPLPALVSWWRGDASFVEAQRMGLDITGPRALVRAFPEWFDRYQFAEIGPAVRKTDKDAIARSKIGHTPQRAATQSARPS
jgi:DNA-binding HxlR family transcriptional regulator